MGHLFSTENTPYKKDNTQKGKIKRFINLQAHPKAGVKYLELSLNEWEFILFDMLKKVLDFYTKYFAVWVIVPLFVGFGVRHYFKEKIEKVLPIFPAISVTFIIFICSLVIALNKDRLAQVTGLVLATAVILNIYGMLGGYGVGSAFRMEVRRGDGR